MFKLGNYLPTKVSKDQAKDTGMAMILISLLWGFFNHNWKFIIFSIVLLVINMTYSKVFRPLAIVWFGLSHLMGTFMSKLLLTIVFFSIVTPVGIIRRIAGADPMQLRKWKKNNDSVFTVRNYTFQPKDMENPY